MSETSAAAPRAAGVLIAGGAGQKIAVIAAFIVLIAALAVISSVVSGLTPDGTAGSVYPNDFSAFWAAGRLALEAGPVAVLDQQQLIAVQRYPEEAAGAYFPFAYPALWLAVSTIPGALPYALAWPLFVVMTLLAMSLASAWALRVAGEGSVPVWPAVLMLLGTPLLFFVLVAGQTTLLWTALAMAGLAALGTKRPLLGGALLGMLAFKPQLGPMIAVALLSYGALHRDGRRAVLAAAASVLAGLALPTLWTGVDYWPAWLGAVSTMGAQVEGADEARRVMLSWYALARGLGLDHMAALALHVTLALILAGALAIAWARPLPARTFGFRAGALLIAVPMAGPSSWYYEALIPAAGCALIAMAEAASPLGGRPGASRAMRPLLLAAWLLPGLLVPLQPVLMLSSITAPLFSTLVLLAVMRSLAEQDDTAHQTAP
ncbi:MAG: glycosyltransferase 87 family protein [Pseudomonadota bacterium]